MAGGPIFPYSIDYKSPPEVFPNFHVGQTNSRAEEGIGVEASLSADATVHVRFAMPPSLPTGTGKLRTIAQANATAGTADLNPQWASVAMEENPDTITLNAEGSSTLVWGTGDADQFKELEITLDADTLVANEIVVMDLVFGTTNWSLAQVSTWQTYIHWE